MLNKLTQLIESNIAGLTILLALVGLLALLALTLAFAFYGAVLAYNKILRVWTPAGWYYSMCMAISDLGRGAKWQEFHVAKIMFFMQALRQSNYPLFCRLHDAMEEIRMSAASQRKRGTTSAN